MDFDPFWRGSIAISLVGLLPRCTCSYRSAGSSRRPTDSESSRRGGDAATQIRSGGWTLSQSPRDAHSFDGGKAASSWAGRCLSNALRPFQESWVGPTDDRHMLTIGKPHRQRARALIPNLLCPRFRPGHRSKEIGPDQPPPGAEVDRPGSNGACNKKSTFSTREDVVRQPKARWNPLAELDPRMQTWWRRSRRSLSRSCRPNRTPRISSLSISSPRFLTMLIRT